MTISPIHQPVVLDVPFTVEEVEGAVRCLKAKKAGSCDLLQPEHIKFGGHQLTVWLMQICNSIIELKDIPRTKMCVINPLYKSGGKNPLEMGSYRGITVTSVWAELLESIILRCLLPVMEDMGLPDVNQTGY